MLFLDTQVRIVETDNYDATQRYPINAAVFRNAEGRYTTREEGKVLGVVIRPPTCDRPKMRLALLRGQ